MQLVGCVYKHWWECVASKVTAAPVLISFFVIGMGFRLLALFLTDVGVAQGFLESNSLYYILGPAMFYVVSALGTAVLYIVVMFAVIKLRLHPAIVLAAGLTFILVCAYDALGDLSLVMGLRF